MKAGKKKLIKWDYLIRIKIIVDIYIDDWECVYIDGVVWEQTHSVEWKLVIEMFIGKNIDIRKYKFKELQIFKNNIQIDNYAVSNDLNMSYFPKNLEDYVKLLKENGYTTKLV